MIGAGNFGFDQQLGELKIEVCLFDDVWVVLTAVDDLHVVDADHRQEVVGPVECRPGFEITDHDLRLEAALCDFAIDLEVVSKPLWSFSQIAEHTPRAIHSIPDVLQGQPVDLLQGKAGVVLKALLEETVGPA